MNQPENNLISVQTSKEITHLYKIFLELIEDLKIDNEIMIKKIAEKNGQEYADSVNFFTQGKYEQLRKRILDHGNECNRQINNFIDFFDFIINAAKVEEAAKQKRVAKKVVINGSFSVR